VLREVFAIFLPIPNLLISCLLHFHLRVWSRDILPHEFTWPLLAAINPTDFQQYIQRTKHSHDRSLNVSQFAFSPPPLLAFCLRQSFPYISLPKKQPTTYGSRTKRQSRSTCVSTICPQVYARPIFQMDMVCRLLSSMIQTPTHRRLFIDNTRLYISP
jgi:hypothetical protein